MIMWIKKCILCELNLFDVRNVLSGNKLLLDNLIVVEFKFCDFLLVKYFES